MNYKLSAYADRPNGVCHVELVCNNRVVKEYTSKFFGNNIKENIFKIVERGLRLASNVVTHNDLLTIELQNRHVVDWLSGKKEYKEYNEWLDLVSSTLETLDCTYMYVFSAEPRAKRGTSFKTTTQLATVGVSSLVEDLEG